MNGFPPLNPQDAVKALLELQGDTAARFADHLRDQAIAAHAAGDTGRAAAMSGLWRLWKGQR